MEDKNSELDNNIIGGMAGKIESLVRICANADPEDQPKDQNKYEKYRKYSELTAEKFKNAVQCLRIASVYVECINDLLSGASNEEYFHRHLEAMLKTRYRSLEDLCGDLGYAQKAHELELSNSRLKELYRWRGPDETPLPDTDCIVVPRKAMAFSSVIEELPFIGIYVPSHNWFQTEGIFCNLFDTVAWRPLDLPKIKMGE